MDRRVRREARLLAREARRGLRRHRSRLPGGVLEAMDGRVRALDEARESDDRGAMRREMTALDELVDEHLSFARKSTWREYVESIGIAVLIALALRAVVIEAFKIPSGSMIPTMHIGDHIFVNKFLYGVRIPLTDVKLGEWREPRRGEVIVFVYPCDAEKDFIKRIVAVEGDEVEVRCSQLFVNGEPAPQTLDEESCTYWDHDEKRASFRNRSCNEAGEGRQWAECGCSLYHESHGGEVYDTIYSPLRPKQQPREGDRDFPQLNGTWRRITRGGEPYLQPRCEPPDPGRADDDLRAAEGKLVRNQRGEGPCRQRMQYIVPDGHVFVMGDNREQSADSRIWGPVPLDQIKGKALFIWWSGRPSFAGGYQWSRIGKLVH